MHLATALCTPASLATCGVEIYKEIFVGTPHFHAEEAALCTPVYFHF
jgi:hypothetical protein